MKMLHQFEQGKKKKKKKVVKEPKRSSQKWPQTPKKNLWLEYLDSTAAQSPWHIFGPRPSGCELSRCCRRPEATSPATGKPRGGCPPGTGLKIKQKRSGDNQLTVTFAT